MYNSYLRMATNAIQNAVDSNLGYAGYNIQQLDVAIKYLNKAKENMQEKRDRATEHLMQFGGPC